jgi:hypothetical protein
MPTKNLKKILNTFTKEQLVKHIIELDKKFKPVQEYHHVFVNNDIDGVLAKYKKQIQNEFYPARGLPKMRLSVARKAITEAKKLGLPDVAMADLMLFYVETGVEFTNDFGDINESFYSSMETMYLRTLELMEKAGILDGFENRAKEIVDNTMNIGWGFHDTLGDYFFQFY